MERQANYPLIGAISVALLIGSLVFIVWLAQFSFNEQYDRYRINFRGPVSGLSKGGEVQFNGIQVGEITHIALDQRDPNLVVTDIQVESGTPVRIDSEATTATQGITGVKYVQITPGSPNRPLLRLANRGDRPVITARRGRLEGFVQDAASLMAGGAEAISRINRILSDSNITTMSTAMSDVGAVTSELRGRRDMFASLQSALAKIDGAASQLQAAASSARTTLGGEGRGTLGEVGIAATELRQAAGDFRTLLARADGSMIQLSSTTLPEMNAALGSIQEAAGALDSLASDLRQDPRGMIGRSPGREVEVPR